MKKLDVIANEAFITSLKRSQAVSLMVSEENEDAIHVKDSEGGSSYNSMYLILLFRTLLCSI